MGSTTATASSQVPLETVLSTEELKRRPARKANVEALSNALIRLSRTLTASPEFVLRELVQTSLELCSAHSSGISLLEQEKGSDIFRWHEVAGQYAPHMRGMTTPKFSPCGTVLDTDAVQLMSRPERYFTDLAHAEPRMEEALLIPFHTGGVAVGTLWVVAHDQSKKFDQEDARVLTTLGEFASAAYESLSGSLMLKSIFATIRDPLLVLDDNLRVQVASRSYYEVFRASPAVTEGRFLYQLGNGAWGVPELIDLLKDILSKQSTFDGFEVSAEFPLLGKRNMLLNARTLRREKNTIGLILLCIEDITNSKATPAKPLPSQRNSDSEPEQQESIHGVIVEARPDFEQIIGNSKAMTQVLDQIQVVAPTRATVLILGETGTGKELVARAVHSLSPRRKGPFITLNCAAIPTGLLESELFGYEKGAFTGALQQKIGRFETANHGTLFLDEVGDIPLALQPKLLRALQEKSFERLGGTRTIPIDVRLVAATNRDLREMMRDDLFRSDLFYRLCVFPIITPPLRERPEDIAILSRHFTLKFARALGRKIETIPAATMKALMSWPWPGNVRELENFIERSVILSQGSSLQAPLSELQWDGAQLAGDTSISHMERDHILRIFRASGGVVSVAAKRLGIPRTTLNAKMVKLGISRDDL